MIKYYLALGGTTPQVCTIEEIHSLLHQGQAKPDTKVCEVGAQRWSTLRELLPHLFSTPAAAPPLPGPPPLPAAPTSAASPAAEAFSKATRAAGSAGRDFASVAMMFAKRILVRNFSIAQAADTERRALESTTIPVRSILAQNYAAWRRAMLWFAGIGLAISAISAVIGYFKNSQDGQVPGILLFINWSIILFRVAGPALVFLAALSWVQVRKSRHLAWLGWLIQFIGPLAILLIPVRHFIGREYGEGFDIGSAIGASLAALLLAIPLILSLFPGIIRAALTVRTLIPESPLPGWICAFTAPIYILIMTALVIVALQLAGGAFILAMLFLAALPVIVFLDVKNLSRPLDLDAMNVQMRKLRLRLNIVAGFGFAFLFIAAFDLLRSVGLMDLFTVACSFLGNLFLVTLIAADLFISLMRVAHEQNKTLHGSPLFPQMDARYTDLAQMRLVGFAEPAPVANPDQTVVLRP